MGRRLPGDGEPAAGRPVPRSAGQTPDCRLERIGLDLADPAARQQCLTGINGSSGPALLRSVVGEEKMTKPLRTLMAYAVLEKQ